MAMLDDLVLRAAEDNSPEVLAELRALLDADPQAACGGEGGEALSLLIESWGETVTADASRAEFCLALATAGLADSPQLRAALQRALRCLFRGGVAIPTPIAIEAVGLRDATVAPPEIVRRFACLRRLNAGVFAAIPEQGLWGRIVAIDEFTAEIRLQPVAQGREIAFPLAGAVRLFLLLAPHPALAACLANPARAELPPSGMAWLALLRKSALTAVTDDALRRASFALLVPGRFTLDEFDAWWKTSPVPDSPRQETTGEGVAPEDGAPPPSATRHPGTARSLAELHLLLTAFDRDASVGARLPEASATAISRLLATAKPPAAAKAVKELAEIVRLLAERLSPECLGETLAPLRERAPWWPSNPAAHAEIPAWDGLAASQSGPLLRATRALFPERYCQDLLLRLPPKCWPAAVAELDPALVQSAMASVTMPGNGQAPPAGAVLWHWKSTGKKPALPWSGRALLKSLAAAESARTAAVKPLRKLILDHAGFQEAMLAAITGEEAGFLAELQHADAFTSGEKQSLLVKLSRISPRIHELLEAGQGRAIMAAQRSANDAAPPPSATPLVTSIRSHRQRIREFEDLVSRQIPENSAAIAHARSYGDLRENAEYKAAKEMQHQLNRRHHELKRDLDTIRAIDFSLVQVDDQVVPGCRVSLALGEEGRGGSETYDLLGAWDGDPERHRLACNTPLGESLVGHRVGDAVTLPDGRAARIAAVLPLAPDLIRELNEA